jgi:serine/threonine protein kinase
MIGGKLIAEGGFGCVFHPAFNEIGEELEEKKYATKIQIENESAANEVKIGKIISKIDGYINHFSPIIQEDKLNIKKFNFNKFKDCSILKTDHKKNNFILMKLDYIKGNPFIDYIIDQKNSLQLINNLIHSYNHLVSGIAILIQNNIVHFDLKGDNILFDEFRKIPILIDFGLSMHFIDINSLSLDTDFLTQYFYIYAPEYYIWPIEVHYLCYILNVNESSTEDALETIIDNYLSNNPAFLNFSSKFIKQYKEKALRQLIYYNRFHSNERIFKIIQHWKTWDNYSLSILYLEFLRYLNINGYDNNKFTIYFSQLLLHNINPNPENRFSMEETKYEFNKFLFDEKINNITSFKKVAKSFVKNRKYFNQALILNKQKNLTLNKKLKSS